MRENSGTWGAGLLGKVVHLLGCHVGVGRAQRPLDLRCVVGAGASDAYDSRYRHMREDRESERGSEGERDCERERESVCVHVRWCLRREMPQGLDVHLARAQDVGNLPHMLASTCARVPARKATEAHGITHTRTRARAHTHDIQTISVASACSCSCCCRSACSRARAASASSRLAASTCVCVCV